MPLIGGISIRQHVLYGAIAVVSAATAAAQSPPNSTTNQIWAQAAEIHEIKNQFVAALRQVAEAMAGTFGDERRGLSSSVDQLDRVRVQWDESISQYEAARIRIGDSAESHVALGTVYLDRHRIDDALREFAAAGRLDPRRADVHSLSALALALDKRFAQAADALSQASTLDHGNPITSYGLAQYLMLAGRQEEAAAALRAFHTALERRVMGPDRAVQPSAPFERVSLLRQVAGVAPIFPLHAYRPAFRLLTTGRYVEAIAAIRRAAAEDPMVQESGQSGDALAEAGAAFRRGQLPRALSLLESAVAITPNWSELHRVLGGVYWVDGQADKSVARFREAIRLSPRDERSRLALADVLVDQGRIDEADLVLGETVTSFPDSGGAHYRLGQLSQTRSLLPRAVQEFEAATALDPLVGVDRLYDTIGSLYSNQADFDAVVDAYVKRIDANPNHADGHVKLGEIYFLQGRNDEALAEFFAALLLDPANSDALAGAGQVYSRTGRYAEAVETSRRAIAQNAAHRGAHYALATALMRLGQDEEGRRELETFQRLQADAIANARRESELKRLKLDAARQSAERNFAGAAELLRQALAYDATDPVLHRDLATALMASNQTSPAISSFERALQLSDDAETHRRLADAYTSVGRVGDRDAQIALAARAEQRMRDERFKKMIGGR